MHRQVNLEVLRPAWSLANSKTARATLRNLPISNHIPQKCYFRPVSPPQPSGSISTLNSICTRYGMAAFTFSPAGSVFQCHKGCGNSKKQLEDIKMAVYLEQKISSLETMMVPNTF